VALRLFIELFRLFLPSTIFVALASLIITVTDILQDYILFYQWLLLLPLLYAIAGIAGIGITALIKWVVVGRYRSGEKPLWSTFVWRNDLVNGVYSNFCEHFFLSMLRGTSYLGWALRLFGMRIGRRCYLDSTWFTEFDLIDIGDDAALNETANLQTHLFEDRVMKMGRVTIAARTSVGALSTVLYGCRMKESILEDLSLLMKGETLPARTRWQGIPARPS
jgi:non-ribosomal peptide synthetase-like protein